MTIEGIRDLMDPMAEELVMTADVAREDFIVTVHRGWEAGVFSKEELKGKKSAGTGEGHL